MRYSHKVYCSTDEINQQDWAKITKLHSSYVFLDYRFIKTIECSMKQTTKFWYVLFYDHDIPIGCTIISLFKVDICTISSKKVKDIIAKIRKYKPDILNFNALFCGTPVSVGQKPLICINEIYFIPILDMLVKLMEHLAKKENSLFNIYKELPEKECKHFHLLEKKYNYLKAESLPMHYFGYTFKDFTEYASSLKARYRNSIRRAKNNFNNNNLKIIQTNDTQKILHLYTDKVHELYLNVVENSLNKLEILPQRFFLELVKNFPNQIFFTFAKDDKEKIVGFNCSLFVGDSFYFIFCGMNYEINYSANLYYNLIYNSLEQAFQLSPELIQIGQTTDDFKARLGTYTEPLYIYIKSKNIVLSIILRLFRNALFPQKIVQRYNIMKKSTATTL